MSYLRKVLTIKQIIMTITEIITAIQKQLQSDFCTVVDFIVSQGQTCEIGIEHETNVHFYIEYQPSVKNIGELQILKVSTWVSMGIINKEPWAKGVGYPAHRAFIQGAFPLLYAERFAEVCEIEAENERQEEAICNGDALAQENGFSSMASSYEY